jgi:hypothetical protein
LTKNQIKKGEDFVKLRFIRSGFVVATMGCLAVIPASAQSTDISPAAAGQIADILSAKAQFTQGQQKMDSGLAFAAMAATGQLNGASYAGAVPNMATDASGNVVVDIRGSATDIVTMVNALGGQVISSYPQYGSVRAGMPLTNMEYLASSASVTQVVQQETAIHSVGALTSQGFISHDARTAVNNLAVNGSGIKVGVLSDSASAARVAALIASGDLGPNTTVLANQQGPSNGTDEGTAMMEIVQDVAPGAQIYFATADNGVASFAANINALAAAGAKVIVDDVTYFNEGAFQDGPIARAVNTVTAAGVAYFSSAGNSGNLTDGTSGTWEGDFSSGGATVSPITEPGLVHNFGTVANPQNYDVLTAGTTFISLKWSDPLGASTNDYDLFILNSAGTAVTAFSATAQNGSQDPYEAVSASTGFAVGSRIVVVQFAGATRALRVDTNRGQLSIKTAGSTFGHNGGQNTTTVAATYWNSARTGTRPFVGAANPVEVFNSDGPRKIFFNPDGTPITPGNFLFSTNGGTTFPKPDITAADGVSAKTPGFNPFFGTSAAAPHAAGIAALVLSAHPSKTGAQVVACMKAAALDNMAPGPDRDGGVGIPMAPAAINACN